MRWCFQKLWFFTLKQLKIKFLPFLYSRVKLFAHCCISRNQNSDKARQSEEKYKCHCTHWNFFLQLLLPSAPNVKASPPLQSGLQGKGKGGRALLAMKGFTNILLGLLLARLSQCLHLQNKVYISMANQILNMLIAVTNCHNDLHTCWFQSTGHTAFSLAGGYEDIIHNGNFIYTTFQTSTKLLKWKKSSWRAEILCEPVECIDHSRKTVTYLGRDF